MAFKTVESKISITGIGEIALVSDNAQRRFNVRLGGYEDEGIDEEKAQYIFPNMVNEGKAREAYEQRD
jgi:hypothetical protein